MSDFEALTPANEDYLEAMVELEEADPTAEIRSVDVAKLLDVSKASVNKALQTLVDAGYVEHEPYGCIWLTENGRRYGAEIWRRHRAIRRFLVDRLGINPAQADEEACGMEHVISKETMDRWVAWLESLDEAEALCLETTRQAEALGESVQSSPDNRDA